MSKSASGEADSSNNDSVKEVSTERLHELYVERGVSSRDIADRFDTSRDKVRTKLLSRGILRPEQKEISKAKLKEYYHDRGLSQSEVADETGLSETAVYRHVNHYDLKKTPQEWQRDRYDTPIPMWTNTRGYETISVPEGGNFSIHRLVAVAEYGIDRVADADVHHKNGVRWDNRPENLEPLSRSAHAEISNYQMIVSQVSKASDDTVKDILQSAGYEDAAKEI